MTPSPVVELKIAGQPCAERGGCFVRMEIHILVFDAAPEPLDERSCESARFGLCRTCGRSARAVGRYSPPGCEKQPGRPVQPRGGDPGRSQRQRGPSLVRPDDGPCSGRSRPGGAAATKNSLRNLGDVTVCYPRWQRGILVGQPAPVGDMDRQHVPVDLVRGLVDGHLGDTYARVTRERKRRAATTMTRVEDVSCLSFIK